jgi:hypothetical protein
VSVSSPEPLITRVVPEVISRVPELAKYESERVHVAVPLSQLPKMVEQYAGSVVA